MIFITNAQDKETAFYLNCVSKVSLFIQVKQVTEHTQWGIVQMTGTGQQGDCSHPLLLSQVKLHTLRILALPTSLLHPISSPEQ